MATNKGLYGHCHGLNQLQVVFNLEYIEIG